MDQAGFLTQVLIFLLAAVVVAPIFQRLRASPILGFLVAGVLIGPDGLGFVAESQTTHDLAELGVLFLLFSIGLELPAGRLAVMRRAVFGLGTAQIVLTGAVLGGLAYVVFDLPPAAAIVVGGGLALSSTAVVLQLLSERGELATRPGRTAFAVLLMQDLAVVPMLTLVPALAGRPGALGAAIGLAALKALVALALILIAGRLVLRPLFRVIAAGRSPELFAAATLLVLLGSSWLTSLAGLSPALGGFLAGVMLAETEFRHQIAADIHPFRGILMGLFFMTVGMSVDLDIVAARLALVAGLVGGLIAVKTVILAALCRLAGRRAGPALSIGLTLAQGGEFAFLLFMLAVADGLLSREAGDLLFAVVAITMALTPLLAAAGARLATRVAAAGVAGEAELAREVGGLRGHVIVAGYGRVGRAVAAMLAGRGIPYVALDLDPERVARARAAGLPVFYGDAARPGVIRRAGIERAQAAVLTMDDAAASVRAAEGLRRIAPAIRLFARARDDGHRRRLESLGVAGIVHETRGLSLELGDAVLAAMEGTAENGPPG